MFQETKVVDIWDKDFTLALNGAEGILPDARKMHELTETIRELDRIEWKMQHIVLQDVSNPFEREDIPNYVAKKVANRIKITKALLIKALETIYLGIEEDVEGITIPF